MPRAYIYTRISRDRTGEGVGVESQEAACRRLAERHGFEVVGVMSDRSASAWSGKRRPAYEQLLEVIRSGGTDVVIAWSIDRVSRRMLDLVRYAEACKIHGVLTYTEQGGGVDMSKPSDVLLMSQLGSIAQYEASLRSERVKLAKERGALEGKFSGGRRPFGWEDNGTTQRPDEAEAIKWAVGEILGGGSLTGVAREWRSRGLRSTVPGRDGEPRYMTATGVRDILLRPRNAGLRQHRGKVTEVAGTWAPLVSHVEWEAMCDVLADPTRRSSFTTQPKYLLTGIARCICGTTVTARKSGRGGRLAYSCNRNNRSNQQHTEVETHVSVRVDLADAYIERLILGDPEAVKSDSQDEMTSDIERYGAATVFGYIPEGEEQEPTPPDLTLFDKEQDDLFTALRLETVAQEEFLERLNDIKSRRTLAESGYSSAYARWVNMRGKVTFAANPRGTWESWSVERRRAMLADFADITIVPPPRLGRNPDIRDRFQVSIERWETSITEDL